MQDDACRDTSAVWADGVIYPLITVDVTSYSHPLWTGTQRIVDAAGQVEKFHRRYGRRPRTGGGGS